MIKNGNSVRNVKTAGNDQHLNVNKIYRVYINNCEVLRIIYKRKWTERYTSFEMSLRKMVNLGRNDRLIGSPVGNYQGILTRVREIEKCRVSKWRSTPRI